MTNEELNNLSTAELEALLQKRKEAEHNTALQRRDAYEAIREDLLMRMLQRVEAVCFDAKAFADFCTQESVAFREVLAEYGQLRNPGQLSFTIRNDKFKWEVKSNKVKRFDERADAAASRLIEFLQAWIKKQKDGVDNPMYQLAMTLLERNKYGDLDYKSISKLYDLESRFNDPEYTDIMNLFKESHLVEGTAINHYFFKRDDLGVWRKLEPSFNRL